MKRIEISPGNLSIDRIEEKCLNCGMCLKTCSKINGMERECFNCGNCILTCPSGALIPKYDYKKVLNYINDTDFTVIAFTAPAVRVAIGDEFGFPSGEFLEGKMVSALRKIGFNYVLDTTFGADLTVMEEANELLERKRNNNKLPLFTSCCPSWVNYMSKFHQNDLDLLSTCKSPIAMEAKMIKTYFSEMLNINSEKIIAVAIAPCVAKKTERMLYPETDIVITTRELSMMIREMNIDLKNLNDSPFDSLMGKASGGGTIFGVSGGVTEAILRTAYYMLNGKKAPKTFYNDEKLKNEDDLKTIEVDMEKFKLKVGIVNKIITAKENYELLKNFDFVEVMSCPGGCINGAGQPLNPIKDMINIRKMRANNLLKDDEKNKIRESYMNPEIQDAYISYLSKNDVKLHTKHYPQKTLQETLK